MPARPNILIVMTDHQRGDTARPEHPAITPHLDRLAADGLLFENAFCPAPHCCPSRATFFSGLYPSGHGVWNNICNQQALSRGLNEGVRLWSEDLADAGYDLHWSGKWHVSVEEGPAERGWTEHFVSAGAGTLHGRRWEDYETLDRSPDRLAGQDPAERGEGEILRRGYEPYVLYGPREVRTEDHDEVTTQCALDVLPELASQDQPWCLFVGLIGPHDPYRVPQEYLDLYDVADVSLPHSYGDEMADKPAIYQRMRETRFGQLSEREVREGVRHFWAYCSYLDAQLGRLLEALEQTGQADDTLVLFCADHGDYCGEHGLFCKGIPSFRGAYHVPAVVRWPAGLAAPGRRVKEFVSLADFAPTFIDLAGLQPERHVAGASLVPFLRGERPPTWREAVFTQCNGVELYYTQRSVMTKDFKYVFNGFDRDELYDLRSDPDEMRNLANDADYEAIKREMCMRMWRFARQEGDEHLLNAYITVALAPYGPGIAFDAASS
jgi:arylsulfatase A-like enzyme